MSTQDSVRVGVTLETVGASAARLSVADDARAAEAAGYDTVWVFDHVLMPTEIRSSYPFTPTGEILWELDDPWFDSLTFLTVIAAATATVEVGTNILLAALRHPLILAKQLATMDQLSGGRLSLGVGAGWLLEEFEALGVDPGTRGQRLDTVLEVLRDAWSGQLRPRNDAPSSVDQGVFMRPAPAHDIPFLIGGTSRAALRRVARHRAGWIAEPVEGQDPASLVESGVRVIHEFAEAAGTPYLQPPRVVYNSNESVELLADRVEDLARVGVTDVAVTVDFTDPEAPMRTLERIREGRR